MTAIHADARPAVPSSHAERRPATVLAAVGLMLISTVGTWLALPLVAGGFGLATAFLVMPWMAVLLLVTVQVARARPSARIAAVVLWTVFAALDLLGGTPGDPGTAVTVTVTLADAAVPVLLLLPPSHRWFAAMRRHVQEWA